MAQPDRPKPTSISDRDYSDDEREWLQAIEVAQRRAGRQLTWPEVLAVAKQLGYRQVASSAQAAAPGRA